MVSAENLGRDEHNKILFIKYQWSFFNNPVYVWDDEIWLVKNLILACVHTYNLSNLYVWDFFFLIISFKHILVENHGKVIFKLWDLKSIMFFPDPGVRQALWLTKTKLIPSLPPQLLSLAENPANQIQDQDERVKNAIKHARFWDTTEDRPNKEKYRYWVAILCSLYLLVLLINSVSYFYWRILEETTVPY